MVDFNFTTTSGTTSFDFGLEGAFTDFNFTEVSDGEVSYDFLFGKLVTIYEYNVFYGTSNGFNAIWADPNASLTTGTFYAARENDLSIIQTENEQAIVKNYFSNELDSTDIVDINVT